MRIGTYNVQAFLGYPEEAARSVLGRGNSMAAAAHFTRVLGNLGCDVLALEEGVSERQIGRVAEALGMHAATVPSLGFWPGHILSRFPISDVRSYAAASSLPRRSAEADRQPFSRMAGAARIVLPSGANLWMVALHLHPQLAAVREVEAAVIEEQVRTHLAETPLVVVLGDFNCVPGEAPHARMAALSFVNVMQAVGGFRPTFDSTGRVTIAIDHIYASPALAQMLAHAEVIRAPRYAHDGPLPEGGWLYSDHLPLIADFAD